MMPVRGAEESMRSSREAVSETARAAAVRAGADPQRARTKLIEETPLSYLSEPAVALRARAEGPPRPGVATVAGDPGTRRVATRCPTSRDALRRTPSNTEGNRPDAGGRRLRARTCAGPRALRVVDRCRTTVRAAVGPDRLPARRHARRRDVILGRVLVADPRLGDPRAGRDLRRHRGCP